METLEDLSEKNEKKRPKKLPFLKMFYMGSDDVAALHGVTLKTAQKYLRQVRKDLKKSPGDKITLEEYSESMNIPIAYLKEYKRKQFKEL